MVHRDIKPPNLFACRLGIAVDFVKVLDFGLAKTLGLNRRGMEDLTNGDAFTPAFMPPEVAIGPHPVDGQTDLYWISSSPTGVRADSFPVSAKTA